MTLPTIEKTWQFNVNQYFPTDGSALSERRRLLLALKNSLKGFGTLPWTVSRCCDSTQVKTDGTDLWASTSNLVWNHYSDSSVRSWMVLRQTGLGSGTPEVCIECNTGTDRAWANEIHLVFSPASGFTTGGSTTARPTASDEITVLDGAWADGAEANQARSRCLHVMQSTDGQCTRVVVTYDITTSMVWIFDKAKNPVSAWTEKNWAKARALNNSYNVSDAAAYIYTRDSVCKARLNGTAAALNLAVDGYYNDFGGSLALNQQASSLTRELPFFPVALACSTSPLRGIHGEAFDLWLAQTVQECYGGMYDAPATLPEDGSKQFVVFGDLIFPWDGTTVPRWG